ncbi:hypothetical protein Q8W40_20445 [Vibrio penaeicida]|uniref:hypothetical protein n=1 Tax=Vibrio penaeicida TaxID=104609 RepID=UPI0027366A68|nr:hypothetical protein [Vibrio penaeicida]MDP2574575.1 hypothetical protein [Vibrio penaeicida]
MSTFQRHHIPFVYFLTISLFWAMFYQSTPIHSSIDKLFNIAGDKPEWFLLLDGIIVLPILCFMCIKDKKEAGTKAAVYVGVLVVLGSFIIPEDSKVLWSHLEFARYLIAPLLLAVEVFAMLMVFLTIKSLLKKNSDPDEAISTSVEGVFGHGIFSKWVCFEIRVWSYALFSSKMKTEDFQGNSHFHGHLKDGTKSNLLGFIFIILFEVPITHVLVHFWISPFAANALTILTLLGMHFFIAEYKALSIRPISLDKNQIYVRYGVWHPRVIQYADICEVNVWDQAVKRAKEVKVYNVMGVPNVEIKLKSGERVYLGVNEPSSFIKEVNFAVLCFHNNQ